MKSKAITIGLLLSLLSEAYSNCNYYQNLEPGQTYYVYNEEYPGNYSGENKCTWEMRSPYPIKINCTLEMPGNNNCTEDYLSIQYDGKEIERYCGYRTCETVGENVTINLISQYDTQGGRFLCKVETFNEYDCRCGWKNPTRIVGGEETGVNEFPMMAGLVDGINRELYCGATIISECYVVTAAHCVTDRDVVNTIGVIVGEHDTSTGSETNATKLYRIVKCTTHPEYNPEGNLNDIAVCKINGTIKYSNEVGPVCLPFQHCNDSFIGSNVTLSGWGLTDFGGAKSKVLQKVDVNVVGKPKTNVYPNKTNNQMCTYTEGKDSCQMDSGGPGMWTNPTTHNLVLAGIISSGVGCASDEPAIYTRVGAYIDWITSQTPDVYYCKVE